MNSTSLHALIVDQHLGELPPEVVELLENHLSENPGARAEADRIRQTLAVTERAVSQHPDLAPVGPIDREDPHQIPIVRSQPMSWLAKAASIALLAALASTAGFLLGKKQEATPGAATLAIANRTERPPRKDSPWARYRVAPEGAGAGMRVVRVDTANLDHATLR